MSRSPIFGNRDSDKENIKMLQDIKGGVEKIVQIADALVKHERGLEPSKAGIDSTSNKFGH